ncbi:unnamed protein product [Arctia plantaginis]|uniref:Uncharacterized protein n=1 Tax=Arctia plantaginis TaxID=874455 RepID=A0A8S0Z6W6_ARCPL|nr:unnamed protein product [Arctia plantaginis]CAB3228370.1 unnamed protein product [Arctia plantaginis]
MPEDSKKHDKRNSKEQRKPRQRHQQTKADKKTEKPEESMSTPKVPQKPPVNESPPPEFYKNLKRETDEILKITEEENAKYKKKEIQSNWSKYELPIESYDNIDEQENLGADYEKLIEASISAGGHFQFKHEKSWDMNTGPSQYDKYFEINMEDLNIALCTEPFYVRNCIKETLFSESDILTMKNRSMRFKQKYFSDKSYATPDSIVLDKTLNILRDSLKNTDNTSKDLVDMEIKSEKAKEEPSFEDKPALTTEINLNIKSDPDTSSDSNQIIDQNIINIQNVPYEDKPFEKTEETPISDNIVAHNDFIFRNTEKTTKPLVEKPEPTNIEISNIELVSQTEVKETSPFDTVKRAIAETKVKEATETKVPAAVDTKVVANSLVAASPMEIKKNPVFESPEDLEKWLDDYLDG